MVRRLLKPSPRARLSERVEELTATRAGVVTAHEAELRRMKQDLQDGTQARPVSLSMRLGLANRAYEHDAASARELLDDAQDQAEEALTELRHVVRGIHPPILTDRGPAGAVRAPHRQHTDTAPTPSPTTGHPRTTAHPAPTLVRYAVPGTSPCHQAEGWGHARHPTPT
ncbi:histidine kinase [Streptomyces sp. NPDC050988]|uniref:histidine kinase n=1 Tax=Streptomyces sp. NPDC050988 TaxID=3365637 RepID=UPI003788C4A3